MVESDFLEYGNVERAVPQFQKQDREGLVQGVANRPEELTYRVCQAGRTFRKLSKLGYNV